MPGATVFQETRLNRDTTSTRPEAPPQAREHVRRTGAPGTSLGDTKCCHHFGTHCSGFFNTNLSEDQAAPLPPRRPVNLGHTQAGTQTFAAAPPAAAKRWRQPEWASPDGDGHGDGAGACRAASDAKGGGAAAARAARGTPRSRAGPHARSPCLEGPGKTSRAWDPGRADGLRVGTGTHGKQEKGSFGPLELKKSDPGDHTFAQSPCTRETGDAWEFSCLLFKKGLRAVLRSGQN